MDTIDTIINSLQDKKGFDIAVVDLTNIGDTICKAFVICTGGSPTQVQALAQNVGEELRDKLHISPVAVDGMRNAQWVAMDYSDVIVHIMLPDAREYYDIENLWEDADLTLIPNID